MDDDLGTLHGVASAHSDSGYASTASIGAHNRTRSTHRAAPAPPASLNARLDRLTRGMADIAHRDPARAGASIGVTRKTIVRDPSRTSKPRAVTIHPRRDRLTEPDPVEPPAKRRRSLPPRITLQVHDSTVGTHASSTASGEDAPLLLTRIRSPHSGSTRIVARSTAEPPKSVETLAGPMELPSFMRGGEPEPQNERHSPTPDWLLQRLSAPSRAYDHQPAPPRSPAQPSRTGMSSAATPPTLAPASPLRLHDVFSGAEPFPLHPQDTLGQPCPLPFSTSGRLGLPACHSTPSPAGSHVPLYEAQMARDLQLFRPLSPPSPRFHPPIAASSLSEPHALAPTVRQARPATPNTVFGQPVSHLALLPLAHTAQPSFLAASPLPPAISRPLVHQPISSDTISLSLSEEGDYNPFTASIGFWQPRPQGPPLHPPSPTPGRARYAALLARSAAEQLGARLAPGTPAPVPERSVQRGCSSETGSFSHLEGLSSVYGSQEADADAEEVGDAAGNGDGREASSPPHARCASEDGSAIVARRRPSAGADPSATLEHRARERAASASASSGSGEAGMPSPIDGASVLEVVSEGEGESGGSGEAVAGRWAIWEDEGGEA